MNRRRRNFAQIKTFVLGSNQFSLELKYFHSLTFIGIIAFLINTIFNYLLDLGFFLTIGTFLYSIVSLYFYYKSRFSKNPITHKIGFAVMGLSLFAFLWVFNGGIEGGATYIFFIILGAYLVILNQNESLIVLILSIVIIFVLIYIDYTYPNVIVRYKSKEDQYIDVAISIVVTVIVNFITNRVIFRNYRILNKRNIRINKSLKTNLSRINSELQLAKKIQTTLLTPKKGSFGDIEYAIKYKPISEVGGDIYHVDVSNNGNLRFFIADATGHGIQAALITMLIFSEYELLRNYSLSPDDTLLALNTSLRMKYASLKIYLTCALVEIDVNQNKIYYAAAGHINQFLIKKKSEVIPLIRTGNILGMSDRSKYLLIEETFEKGDSILLFTDGLTDEFASIKSKLKEEDLIRFLIQNEFTEIDGILSQIYYLGFNEMSEIKQDDDLTMILIRKKS
ncbi:MAG: PP2C family protein-serine/threonine phosphatase [Leptospiraceae bacterium]|nr:PP2C family protein-serine/threonine phosphatase [Leptospiraceae bacterium]